MAKKLKITEESRFYVALTASILLHLLLLISFKPLAELLPERKSFNETDIENPKKPLVFQIVESNPNAEIESPPENADLISDRNTQASDNLPDSNPLSNRPNSIGPVEAAELPAKQSTMNELLKRKDEETPSKFSITEAQEGKSSETEKKQDKDVDASQFSAATNQVTPDNRFSNAGNFGNFSLSTIEWNFAPYMLELKKAIDKNVSPPAAFTRLGIIDGTYILRFTVTKEGTLKRLQVLESQGSSILRETSMKAIEFSFPFMPLPKDFPEEELTITGRFQFIVRRR